MGKYGGSVLACIQLAVLSPLILVAPFPLASHILSLSRGFCTLFPGLLLFRLVSSFRRLTRLLTLRWLHFPCLGLLPRAVLLASVEETGLGYLSTWTFSAVGILNNP